jgi:hypothetical protein
MCNLYTWKMTAAEMRALKLHFQFIGTTWSEWEERQRGRNEPPQSAAVPVGETYPNYEVPVIVDQDGTLVVRQMRWGFPPPSFIKSKAPVTNVRNIASGHWKAWLGQGHRCLVRLPRSPSSTSGRASRAGSSAPTGHRSSSPASGDRGPEIAERRHGPMSATICCSLS